MEDDYYSVESILAENQKIQCTFKVDIPDMGHLDGGNERDVRETALRPKPFTELLPFSDQSTQQDTSTHVDGVHPHLLVRFTRLSATLFPSHTRCLVYSDYADFTIPPPFSARVRNALNAEARSVRLSGLVGQGGLWYGFGRMLMQLYVPTTLHHCVAC